MDSEFSHNLIKKDEDAIIKAIDEATGTFIVNTTVNMEDAGMVTRSGPQLTDLIDDSLLERESKRRLVPIEIRIVRFVFAIQMMTALFVATIGYIMFYILNYDESHKVAKYTFIGTSVFVIAEYVTLVLTREMADYIIVPTLLFFIFTIALWCGALSSMIHNIVPLQACASVMMQSCAVFAYSLDGKGRENMDPYYAAGYMLIGHLVAWFVGLLVFVRESDWLWAMILFFFGFINVVYGTWQIFNIDRYCLSQRDRILALIHYYIDPVIQFKSIINDLKKIKNNDNN
jgi:hypothetical protein